MRTSKRIGLLALGLATMLVSPARACGDKVAALGSGVPFDRVMAHHATGRVVVFMDSGATSDAGEVQNRLVRALERAGHRVRVVHTETELVGTLQGNPADVVLADITPTAPPAVTALATTCVIHPLNRKPGNVVRAVDDIVARRNSAGDNSCVASGHAGI